MNGSLYIEITSKCNLSCTHCYNKSSIAGNGMMYDEFKSIIDQSNFVNTICISGGEPLLHPDIYKILEYVSRNSKAQIRIITNGLLIDENFVTWANENLSPKRFQFQISKDGNDAQTYESIRGKGTFSAFQKATNASLKLRHEVYFHVTLCKVNMHQIEEFVKTAALLKHKRIDFALIKPFGRTLSNSELLLQKDDLLSMQKCFDKIKGLHMNIKVTTPDPFYGVCTLRIGKYERLSIRVDSSLNVYPCQMMSLPIHSIGNLKRQSFQSILSDENLSKLTQRINEHNNDNCSTCIAKMICGRGCPAVEMIKLEGKSTGCIHRIAFISEQLLGLNNTDNP